MRLNSLSKKHNHLAIAIDFFCGAGGATRGFIDAGIMVLAGIDNDSSCRKTYEYEKNNLNPLTGKPPKYIQKDISFNKDEILSELTPIIADARERYPEAPLIFAICAPCQPFTQLTRIRLAEKTTAQRRNDSGLLEATLRYIRELLPDAIFSENVTGITKQSRYGNAFASFCSALQPDYRIGSSPVNAKYFGVPQNRRRNVFLAVRRRNGREHSELRVPLGDPIKKDLIKVRDVLGTSRAPGFPIIKAGEASPSDPNHRSSRLSKLNLKRIRLAQPGKPNYSLGNLRVESHKKSDKNNNPDHHCDVYGRMDPNKVAPTITTKCYSFSNGRYGYPYKNQNRAISLREAAVLQSFPEWYTFFPQDGIVQVGKQIGNAVPPKLAEFFGLYLLELLKDDERN